jgi:hypothetical protein
MKEKERKKINIKKKREKERKTMQYKKFIAILTTKSKKKENFKKP